MHKQNFLAVDDVLKFTENGDYIDFEFYTHFSILINPDVNKEFEDIKLFHQNISAVNENLEGITANINFLGKTFNMVRDMEDIDDKLAQDLFGIYSELNMKMLMSSDYTLPVLTSQMIPNNVPYLENVIQENTKVFMRNVVGFDGLGTLGIKVSIHKDDLDNLSVNNQEVELNLGKVFSTTDSEIVNEKFAHYFDGSKSVDFIELVTKVNPDFISDVIAYMMISYEISV